MSAQFVAISTARVRLHSLDCETTWLWYENLAKVKEKGGTESGGESAEQHILVVMFWICRSGCNQCLGNKRENIAVYSLQRIGAAKVGQTTQS